MVQLVAFCVFEVLIGMFWPSMMTLRAKYVPEQQRSTIINVFRIPLNLFVCLILWKVGGAVVEGPVMYQVTMLYFGLRLSEWRLHSDAGRTELVWARSGAVACLVAARDALIHVLTTACCCCCCCRSVTFPWASSLVSVVSS
jgi:hypothetical protein